MFRKFIISCDEATTICDKNQYGEATFSERIKLVFHILICKICSLYSKQNAILTKAYKGKAKEVTKKQSFCLSDQAKQQLQEEINKANA